MNACPSEMAKELLALVDSGTIRVIDMLILTKNGAPVAKTAVVAAAVTPGRRRRI